MLPLIVGNWKMHGSKKSVVSLLTELRKADPSLCLERQFVVCPPFVFLAQCADLLSSTSIQWGAQNVCIAAEGAYTGEISAAMLKDFHCRYVIIGHSERRQYYGETDASVAAKCLALWQSQITAIVCIGETQQEREAGKTQAVIAKQLAGIGEIADNLPSTEHLVIAYEPVWAIGSGMAATGELIETVLRLIREQLKLYYSGTAFKIRILYGGSVTSQNAPALFELSDINGVLVGKASLNAIEFLSIGKLCKPLS